MNCTLRFGSCFLRVPLMYQPCCLCHLARQARGTHKRHLTKPYVQFILSLSRQLSLSSFSAEVAASGSGGVLQMQHGERPARNGRDSRPVVVEARLGAHVRPEQLPDVQRKVPEKHADGVRHEYCRRGIVCLTLSYMICTGCPNLL